MELEEYHQRIRIAANARNMAGSGSGHLDVSWESLRFGGCLPQKSID
jgi:hypothetical protein